MDTIEAVITLWIFVAFSAFVTWYSWRRLAALLKLPCNFWISFELFHWVFLARKRETFGRYIFLKMVQVCKNCGDKGMVLCWLFPPILLIYNEESVKFFSNEETVICRPHFYEFLLGPQKTSSILASGGEKWKKERRLIAPAFKISVLREMVSAMNRHAADLVQHLNRYRNQVIDNTEELIKIHAIRLFYESAMGVKQDVEETNEKARKLMEYTERLLELVSLRMARPWLYLNFVWNMSPYSKQTEKVYDDIRRLIRDIISQLEKRTVLNRSESSVDPELDNRKCKTFSEALMDMHLQDPSFTIDDLIGQLYTIIGSGFDTSSSSLTWIFWLLGLHPDVQERAYDEVTSQTGQLLTFEDARKLSYLECIIKESLRLYPVVPMYGRTSDQDVQFGKYRIPKGTPVIFALYSLHRNPEIYPDPEAFNPDRFQDTAAGKISPWTMLAFGEGMRFCIGKNYAMLHMKIFLAHVLKMFRIVSLDRREDVLLTWEIMLKPMSPLRMKFIPR